MFNLESAVYSLLKSEPFFAHLLLGMKISYDVPGLDTAGVCVRRGTIELALNTSYLNALPTKTQIAVLKHEMMHLLLDHCTTRNAGDLNHQLRNVAMDCAINQYIEDLPEGGITLPLLEEKIKEKLLPFETFEYYFEKLKNSPEIETGYVNHDFMDQSDPENAEIAKATVKDAANKALKAAAGKVPKNIESIVGALNKSAAVNWKQRLRNFVASARHIDRLSTRSRVHRRFGFDAPGYKKKKKLVLGVCVDSSGSISDEQFSAFMKEVSQIVKETSITYLVDADAEVQNVAVLKAGVIPKKNMVRHGNGGTAYQPAINACQGRSCDAIIYFGDFDCSDTPSDPKVPFIWVGVGNQEPPGNFGQVIRI